MESRGQVSALKQVALFFKKEQKSLIFNFAMTASANILDF